jgi:hypothetical protein
MLADLQERRSAALANVIGASGPASKDATASALRDNAVYARGRLDEAEGFIQAWFPQADKS